MVVGSSPVAVTCTLDIALASSKQFLDIQATTECGFTLKCVRDMIRTYSQLNKHISFLPPPTPFLKGKITVPKNWVGGENF